jgi:hypothetical protein
MKHAKQCVGRFRGRNYFLTSTNSRGGAARDQARRRDDVSSPNECPIIMPTRFVTLCTRSWYQSQAPRQPLQGPRDDDLKGVVARELGRVLVLRHVVPLAFVLALVLLSSRRCRSSNSNSSSSSSSISGRLSTRRTRRAFHQESHPRRRRLVLDFYSSKCSHPRDANLNNLAGILYTATMGHANDDDTHHDTLLTWAK